MTMTTSADITPQVSVAQQPPVIVVPKQDGQGGGAWSIAGEAVGAFRTSPVLLLIVILNIAFAGAGAYYLLQLEKYRSDDRQALVGILDKCVAGSVPISYLKTRDARPE